MVSKLESWVNIFKEREKLSEAEVIRLFNLSYFLAQGGAQLQRIILHSLVLRGDMDRRDVEGIALETVIAGIKIPGFHEFIVGSQVSSDSSTQWNGLVNCIGDNEKLSVIGRRRIEGKNRWGIFNKMVSRDHVYQKQPRIRELKGVFEADAVNDPHASWVRKYMVCRKHTGYSAYDRLFRDVWQTILPRYKKFLGGKLGDSDDMDMFSALIEEWEKNHPGEVFLYK